MKIDGVKLLKDFCEKFDVYETVGTKDVIRFLIDHLDDTQDTITHPQKESITMTPYWYDPIKWDISTTRPVGNNQTVTIS